MVKNHRVFVEAMFSQSGMSCRFVESDQVPRLGIKIKRHKKSLEVDAALDSHWVPN